AFYFVEAAEQENDGAFIFAQHPHRVSKQRDDQDSRNDQSGEIQEIEKHETSSAYDPGKMDTRSRKNHTRNQIDSTISVSPSRPTTRTFSFVSNGRSARADQSSPCKW